MTAEMALPATSRPVSETLKAATNGRSLAGSLVSSRTVPSLNGPSVTAPPLTALLVVLPADVDQDDAVDEAIRQLTASLGHLRVELIPIGVPAPYASQTEARLERRHLRSLVRPSDEIADDVAASPDPDEAEVGDPSELIRAGELKLNLASLRASVGGREVVLRYRELRLLRTLMQQSGRVLSRRELLIHAWDYDSWGAESWEAGRTVDVHVRRLRAKLGPEAARIVTVRGAGYRFDS